jgi:uncharacterized membrane protein
MPCDPEILKNVSLFALLDEEELAVLAAQVEQQRFAPRQRIYKLGDPASRAYVVVSGLVKVTTIDDDQQEVDVDEPGPGDFFGFASMLDQTPHQTTAVALEETHCIEVDRNDIEELIRRKPLAGMDLLATQGRQFHATHRLVRVRAHRNPNDLIESEATFGERIADAVAGFGGSWTFILSFLFLLAVYTSINISLGRRAWDAYPFILLNLFLSMLAAFQAPIIMMSQNRTDAKDRLRGELDYAVNRRAEMEIQQLSRKLHVLSEKLDDVEELLRDRNATGRE